MEVPEKIKNTATIRFSIYPDKTIIQKYISNPYAYNNTIYNSQDRKQPKCPSTDESIKMWYTYTMEYYSAIKKKEIMPFAATWMELEMIILSDVSQKEKDKYHLISLTRGIKKYDTNELIYKTEIEVQRIDL